MLTFNFIDPVALAIGPVTIYWYGLMYLFGFIQAYTVAHITKNTFTPPYSNEDISNLLFYIAMGIIFGGSLGYWLFYQPQELLNDWLLPIKIWQPGRSFHGGIVGTLLGLLYFRYQSKRSLLAIGDFVAPTVPLAIALGRIGNFINQELWGRPTTMPWGIVFPNVDNIARHPAQLYAALLEGVVLFIVLWHIKKTKPRQGVISGAFFLGYGILRSLSECFRQPDLQLGFIASIFTMGQLLSLPLIIIGILLICKRT